MRLMISSLSPNNLRLLIWRVLSILLTSLVFMALFCAAIRRDFVGLLKFPFRRHVHVFPCEILFITIIIINDNNLVFTSFSHLF